MKAGEHPRIVPPTLARALAQKADAARQIGIQATIDEALHRLSEADTEVLVVMQDERPYGLFSEHDLCRFLSDGGKTDAPLEHAVSGKLVQGGPDDEVESWLQKSATEHIPHLLVSNGSQVLGVLSRIDLLAASDAHHRRVCQAIDLDQRLMFKRGVYSC